MSDYFTTMKGLLYNKDHLSPLLKSITSRTLLLQAQNRPSCPHTPLPAHGPSAPSTSEPSSPVHDASHTGRDSNTIKSSQISPKCKCLTITSAQWILRSVESEWQTAKLYEDLDQITRYSDYSGRT